MIENSEKPHHLITKARLKDAHNKNERLAQELADTKMILKNYQVMLGGGAPKGNSRGTICLPPSPKIRGRVVHAFWPDRPCRSVSAQKPVAANETASATGDPHIKGGDGGRFDFQGRAGRMYNLLNDTNLQINAHFKGWPGGGTAIGQIGVMLSGRGGYSRVYLAPQRGPSVLVRVNGRLIGPGQSTRLADGGTLHMSRDGRTVHIKSAEGYQTRITAKGAALKSHLDVHIASSRRGVVHDGRLPGGLLGHTFDTDSVPRHGAKGRDAQGEGAIDGRASDYEVIGGLYGRPKPQIAKGTLLSLPKPIGPAYRQYFGLASETSFNELGRGDIQQMWRHVTEQMAQNHVIQNVWLRHREQSQESRKIELLLMAALNSGNMDLAVVMLTALETKTANRVTQGMIRQIHSLQQQRQSLSTQMANLGAAKDDKAAAKNAQSLQSLANRAQNLGTEISLLQTFLQDAMASKRNIQEFASNWLRASHETSRAIIQNIGR